MGSLEVCLLTVSDCEGSLEFIGSFVADNEDMYILPENGQCSGSLLYRGEDNYFLLLLSTKLLLSSVI